MLAAQLLNSKIIERGYDHSIRLYVNIPTGDMIQLPIMQLKTPTSIHMETLAAINPSQRCIAELVRRLTPKLSESSDEFDNEYKKVHKHIDRLQALGLIAKIRDGKFVRVDIREFGKIILEIDRAFPKTEESNGS